MHLKKQNDKEYKITYSNYDEIYCWQDILFIVIIFLIMLAGFGIMIYFLVIN